MPLHVGATLPDLSGVTEWLNGMPDEDAMIGHPVLVHFWAVSCHICHENMPTVARWRDGYAVHGLRVIAIHMPREETDTNVTSVRADIEDMGMTEHCGIDNLHTVAETFENPFVPAYYLFDAEGKLVGRAAGYQGLKMIAPPLQRLLGEI